MEKYIYFAANYLIGIQMFLVSIVSFKGTSFREGIIYLVASIILGLFAWFVSFLMKHTLKRLRPDVSLRLFNTVDLYSFPSSHATTLAALAAFIYLHDTILGLFALLVACCVGFARVCAHIHFPRDIIAGIILGLIIGLLGTHYAEMLSINHFFIHIR